MRTLPENHLCLMHRLLVRLETGFARVDGDAQGLQGH